MLESAVISIYTQIVYIYTYIICAYNWMIHDRPIATVPSNTGFLFDGDRGRCYDG